MLARRIENIDIVPPKILLRSFELFFLYAIYSNAQLIWGLSCRSSILVLGQENTRQVIYAGILLKEEAPNFTSATKILCAFYAAVLMFIVIKAFDRFMNLVLWNVLNCIPGLRTHYQKNLLALDDNLRILQERMNLITSFSNEDEISENEMRLKVRDISKRNLSLSYSFVDLFSGPVGDTLKYRIKIYRHERFAMRQHIFSAAQKTNEWCQDHAPFFAKKFIRYTNVALSNIGIKTNENVESEAEDLEVILNSDIQSFYGEQQIEIAKNYFEYINIPTRSSTKSSRNLVNRYNIDTLEIFLALNPERQNWILQLCEGNEQTIFAKIDQFDASYRSAFDAVSRAYRRHQ